MARDPVPAARYTAHRLTVRTGMAQAEFRSRYEDSVPPLPREEVMALVQRGAPWQDMIDFVDRVAPWGFLIYWCGDYLEDVVRLAGDQESAVPYLMGNHTIMERMFPHEPSVLLYAPLHTVIWSDPGGEAYFSADKPSDQFGGFGNADVAAVGRELDRKLAVLLDHLGVAVPAELLAS
jgi:hypothetical protein